MNIGYSNQRSWLRWIILTLNLNATQILFTLLLSRVYLVNEGVRCRTYWHDTKGLLYIQKEKTFPLYCYLTTFNTNKITVFSKQFSDTYSSGGDIAYV